MRKINVLLTGGLGFVGWNLAHRLLQTGACYVNVYDKRELDEAEWYHSYFSGEELYIEDNSWTDDILDANSLIFYQNDGMDKYPPDVIFHFGEFARVEQSLDINNIDELIRSNIIGTGNVLRLLCQEHLRNTLFFYAGSSTRFSFGSAREQSPYALTKANNADLVRLFREWFSLRTAVLYFYNVFGKSRYPVDTDMETVIDSFERLWREDKNIVVYGGEQSRVFTHIDDVVFNIMKIMFSSLDGMPASEYHLVSDMIKPVRIDELARMFYDDSRIDYLPMRPGCRLNTGVGGLTYGEYNITVQDYIKRIKHER